MRGPRVEPQKILNHNLSRKNSIVTILETHLVSPKLLIALTTKSLSSRRLHHQAKSTLSRRFTRTRMFLMTLYSQSWTRITSVKNWQHIVNKLLTLMVHQKYQPLWSKMSTSSARTQYFQMWRRQRSRMRRREISLLSSWISIKHRKNLLKKSKKLVKNKQWSRRVFRQWKLIILSHKIVTLCLKILTVSFKLWLSRQMLWRRVKL